MQPSRRTALALGRRAFCALLAVVALAALPPLPARAQVSTSALVKPATLRVCIDPGHGGGYSGAYYGGVAEKTLNLQIAKKLGAELQRRGFEVSYTRTGDSKVYLGGGLRTWRWSDAANSYIYKNWPVEDATDRLSLDLQARADRANAHGADLYISIHNNAGGSSARGIEVWRSGNDPMSEQFATDVLSATLSRTGAPNRGVQKANFYVTRWSNMPAVLVECGFMSNSAELSLLKASWYQQRLAEGIANGVEKFSQRGANEPYQRIAGANRWYTAAAVAQRSHPTGADEVVLASGMDFADSLVAGPLAYSLSAPILTTETSSLPVPIAAELARLSPERITIIGGPNAVASSVATAAAQAAGIPVGSVRRISGRSRYDVAVNVAKTMRSGDPTGAVVASGTSWADALSITASAARRGEPILLAPKSGLTDAAYAYLAEAAQPPAITVVGGAAVIPDAGLRGLPFSRLSGANRYDTNWAVIGRRYKAGDLLTGFIASGEKFADALVLGPYAASTGRPVLLVGHTTVSAEVRPWLYTNRKSTFAPTIVGGTSAISAYVAPSHEKWRMNQY